MLKIAEEWERATGYVAMGGAGDRDAAPGREDGSGSSGAGGSSGSGGTLMLISSEISET
jgi:hypothetical protein